MPDKRGRPYRKEMSSEQINKLREQDKEQYIKHTQRYILKARERNRKNSAKEWGTSAIERNNKCSICGKETKYTSRHHIILREYGGDEAENLIELCRGCHLKWHRYSENVLVKYALSKMDSEELKKMIIPT